MGLVETDYCATILIASPVSGPWSVIARKSDSQGFEGASCPRFHYFYLSVAYMNLCEAERIFAGLVLMVEEEGTNGWEIKCCAATKAGAGCSDVRKFPGLKVIIRMATKEISHHNPFIYFLLVAYSFRGIPYIGLSIRKYSVEGTLEIARLYVSNNRFYNSCLHLLSLPSLSITSQHDSGVSSRSVRDFMAARVSCIHLILTNALMTRYEILWIHLLLQRYELVQLYNPKTNSQGRVRKCLLHSDMRHRWEPTAQEDPSHCVLQPRGC
jgi:hypothetical protein